jgi:hypothetical protein
LLFHIFSGLKDMSSWNPQWQAVRHGCTISLLKQYRLKCSGDTQILWNANNLKSVSLLEKFWHLFSGMQRNHPHQIHAFGHNSQCDHCMRLFAGTDVDIWHEMWSFSLTLQLHTAHVGHKSYCSCFTGNLWTMHPIVWPCTFRLQVSCVGASEATLGRSPVPHNDIMRK